MSSNNSHDSTLTYNHLSDILSGMKTAWPASQTTLVVEQQTFTVAQFEAQVTTLLVPFQAVVDARAVLQTALGNRADALTNAQKFVAGFYAVLPQYLGSNSGDATKFGKSPPKARTPLTVEQKAAAAAKAKATRAARHTMGKKQKKAITGATPPAPGPVAPVVAPKV